MATPATARSTTYRRPARRRASSTFTLPSGRALRSSRAPRRPAVRAAASRRSRYSISPRRSKRSSRSQKPGSDITDRACPFRVSSSSTAPVRRRSSFRRNRADDPSRVAARATDRRSSAPVSSSSTTSASASGSTNVTSMRSPSTALTNRNWSPSGTDCSTMAAASGASRYRSSARLRGRAPSSGLNPLLDQEGVRRVVHLDRPGARPQPAAGERVGELLVQQRAHRGALERTEDDDAIEPVEELRPEGRPDRASRSRRSRTRAPRGRSRRSGHARAVRRGSR